MRAFACDVCGSLLGFESSLCLACGTRVGYDPDAGRLVPLGPATRPCAHLGLAGCTWLTTDAEPLCRSCRLTRTRPRDGDVPGLAAFARAEEAKRRLVHQLLGLGLPVVPRTQDPVGGLAFDLLSSADTPVTTGHADGVVTIDLAEGHDPHREAMRVQMGEPYRTLLGHLRHEVGHYYWGLLTAQAPALERVRGVFGDDRADYAAALDRHYANGPPAGWGERFVSAYATAHPWEDWAETFAHYLHIRDTLQTAAAYGVVVTGPDVVTGPPSRAGALVSVPVDGAPAAAAPDRRGVREYVDTWLPLTYALNAVNRSMGKDDLYPFVLSPVVIGKLDLVHTLVTS